MVALKTASCTESFWSAADVLLAPLQEIEAVVEPRCAILFPVLGASCSATPVQVDF